MAAKTSDEDIYISLVLDKSVKYTHTDKFNFDHNFKFGHENKTVFISFYRYPLY